jgi:hypothetical protein
MIIYYVLNNNNKVMYVGRLNEWMGYIDGDHICFETSNDNSIYTSTA